jgi:hypothetical protein
MVAAIFIPAIFIAAIVITTAAIFAATLVVATTRFVAAVFDAKLVVVIVAAVFIIFVAGEKVVAGRGVLANSVAGKLGRGDRGESRGLGAKVRRVGLLLGARGCEIAGDRFFFVEADLAGVGADEAFIENSAGELVEVFVFEGAQHAGADFRGVGDGIEFDAAQLALLAKFFSERAHDWLQLGFCPL